VRPRPDLAFRSRALGVEKRLCLSVVVCGVVLVSSCVVWCYSCCVKRSTGHTHTHTSAEHTTAKQTTHTNTERATAQRRLIVEVVVAALFLCLTCFSSFTRPGLPLPAPASRSCSSLSSFWRGGTIPPLSVTRPPTRRFARRTSRRCLPRSAPLVSPQLSPPVFYRLRAPQSPPPVFRQQQQLLLLLLRRWRCDLGWDARSRRVLCWQSYGRVSTLRLGSRGYTIRNVRIAACSTRPLEG